MPSRYVSEYASYQDGGLGNDVARQCGPAPEVPDSVYLDPAFSIASLTVEAKLLPANELVDVKVTRSSGFKALDDAALRAVSNWRCNLTELSNRPANLVIPFVFRAPGVPPTPTSISTVWIGTYAVESSQRVVDPKSVVGMSSVSKGKRPLERTRNILAEHGANFGLSLVFSDENPDSVVRYRTVWRFPPAGIVNPEKKQRFTSEERLRRCRAGTQCTISWVFIEDWEMVPGTWTIEVWLNERLAISESFEVLRK